MTQAVPGDVQSLRAHLGMTAHVFCDSAPGGLEDVIIIHPRAAEKAPGYTADEGKKQS
jgi:hypothetical protein